MFKIAYCAGHYLQTPGKRVPAALDPGQTREWVLNDRVADAFAQAAQTYDGVMLLRTDDPSGGTDISIRSRTDKANTWGADLYIDMHHNAGIDLGNGGGVVAFCHPGSTRGAEYRDAIYAAVIAAGGLKGNRAQPLQEKAFDSLRLTAMPAVLMEYGFMDSATDWPVISRQEYSQKVGEATMTAVAKIAGLQKKTQNENEEVCNVELKVLKRGSRGNAVRAMQRLLIGEGISCGPKGADGEFGAKTDAALRAYQSKMGLTADGACGAATWGKLLGV